jgi:hypothetical protein
MSRQAILNAWHAVSRFVQRVNAIISWDPVSTNGTVFLQLNDVAVLLSIAGDVAQQSGLSNDGCLNCP